MAALQYVDVSRYRAIIFRRTDPQLEDLIDLSHDWFDGLAIWSGKKNRWTFPRGATIKFGHMQYEKDKYKFKGPSFQFVGWDELTEFLEPQYRYLFSRCRRPSCEYHKKVPSKNCKLCKRYAEIRKVPIRVRAASNPDGAGRIWVRNRFVTEQAMDDIANDDYQEIYYKPVVYEDSGVSKIPFVPSRIEDNFGLDQEEYIKFSLSQLDPVTRLQLRKGDWRVSEQSIFRDSWIRYYTERGEILEPLQANFDKIGQGVDRRGCQRFFTVDSAGTSKQREAEKRNSLRASWSVCGVWDYWPSTKYLFLRHIWREKVDFTDLLSGLREVHKLWGPGEMHVENAHFGPAVYDTLKKEGLPVRLLSTHVKREKGMSGKPGKVERSAPLQNKFQRGEVFLPRYENTWRPDYEAELLSWTGLDSEPADQIDISSYAGRICESGNLAMVMDSPFWR